jgi:hypothetical protein
MTGAAPNTNLELSLTWLLSGTFNALLGLLMFDITIG